MFNKILDYITKPSRNSNIGFYRDENWTVYEAIIFAMVVNKTIIGVKSNQDILTDFRMYENAIVNGIDNGELVLLKDVCKKESKGSRELFAKIVTLSAIRYNIATDDGNHTPEKSAEIYKIDMAFMLRCIQQDQIVNYFISKNLIQSEGTSDKNAPHPSTEPEREPSKKKRGKAGADAIWIEGRKPVLDCADEFMKHLLTIDCKCRHDVLAKIAYECTTYQGKHLIQFEKENWGLKNAIKANAKELLPKDRIFGTPEYTKASRDGKIVECPIQDHKQYRRRE